jgi:hypothetical protein
MKSKFIKFPTVWVEQLGRIGASVSAYRVAFHLLNEAWRSGNNRVKLANGVLAELGVSRFAKRRALAQLDKAGVVAIEQQPRKSPFVTVRYTS